MPYIPGNERNKLITNGEVAQTLGQLTYLLTHHCLNTPEPWLHLALRREAEDYLDVQDAVNYSTLASIIGCFQCARLEFRRRRPDDYIVADDALADIMQDFYRQIVAPYEDNKIKENGDVFA